LKYSKFLPIIFFFITFSIFFVVGGYWTQHQRPAGDEPHYLIIAQSLIADRDFDLKNNYDNRDYSRWGYPTEVLDRHISPNNQGGHQYSVHNIGWPVLFAPALKLGGRFGVVLFAEILAALLAVNIFLFVYKFTKNLSVSLITSIPTIFALPIIIYAFQSFNEIAAALLIFYSFRKIYEKTDLKIELLLVILAISFLFWLHTKYLSASFMLLILFLITYRKEKIFFYFAIGIYLLSLSGMLALFKIWYGGYLPNAQYPSQFGISLSNLPQGGLGLLLDQAFGLLVYSPIYIISLAGLVLLWKKDRRLALMIIFVFLAVFLLAASAAQYLGFSPVGRFFTPVIALLILPIANAYDRGKTFTKVFFWLACLWGLLSSYFLIRYPDLAYNISSGKFLNGLSSKLIDFTKFFPKMINLENYPTLTHRNIILVLAWIGIILLINILVFRDSLSRNARHKSCYQ